MSRDEGGTFQAIGNSDDRMYGPRAIIASGFRAEERSMLAGAAQKAGMGDAILCMATASDTNGRLGDLARGSVSSVHDGPMLARAVILSGASEAELHRFMSAYRASGLARPLWATLTETSEQWTLGELLSALAAERKAIEG